MSVLFDTLANSFSDEKPTWIIYTMITSSYPIDRHSGTLSSFLIRNLWLFVNCG